MKRIVVIISAIALLACAVSCNKKITGDDEVAALKAMVLDARGDVIFDKTTISGLYMIGLDDRTEAIDLVSLYAGDGFDGDNYTRMLADDKGTVKITKGTDGVFYSVRFGVEGIPAFTLDVVDANGDNDGLKPSHGESVTYHKCGVCGKTWRSHSSVCPWTSKHPQDN